MSGFGFGFGSSPPPASGGFGPPAQPGGFGGNANSPFGGGGGGGFGAAPATTFAAPASFAPAPAFGTPASNTTTGFSAPVGGGFGSSGGGFGGGGGFGQPQQQQTPAFGQSPNTSTGFGSSNTTTFGVPFGSSQQQQQQQQSNVPNPFGGPSAPASFGAPAPAVAFGMSSNVVTGMNAGGGTSFSAPPHQSTGAFGSAAPFGSGLASGGMTFDNSSAASHSRGQSTGSVEMGSNSPTPTAAFGSPFHATNINMDGGSGSLSPIPEDSMGDNPFSMPRHQRPASIESSSGSAPNATEDDKLAKLKAKIEAKKKKLMDRQKRKQDKDSSNNNNDQPPPPQNQSRHQRSRSTSPVPLTAENTSRAERNALRFSNSTNTSTQAFMPSELKGKSDAPAPSSTSVVAGERGREDLANAKSLIGTCEYMCPDEELLRRERENDIQLLEIPDPGGIHPPDWTLRNTAVKRFRRSAADYKLDVPEWVRPPDVLERVCSYLEEWVMERDRQGPDRRFPQNQTPNSLDVYQFIWDRTRMIRKDFILQNYVGTGGECDARAVRCHERIARWHAMCEHQLSHINDFVVMQSQQNIQELGQAMKTLNQYYDDSLGRATVDVPDKEGKETRSDMKGFAHGCDSDVCQGGTPVDYDGTPLNNSADPSSSLAGNRLVGKVAVNSPTRGTAEPEMRGLYILLTMNNEGGMEVMKYSARLYRERPEIYNSRPVQLALSIFKVCYVLSGFAPHWDA
jgi:hypothetical protein